MTAKDLRRIRMPSSLLMRKLRPEATARPAPAQTEQSQPVVQEQQATAQPATAAQPRLDANDTSNPTSGHAVPEATDNQLETQSDTIKPRTPKQSLGALRTPQPLVNGYRPGTAWELPRGSQPVPVATLESLHKQDEPVEEQTAVEEPVTTSEPEAATETKAEDKPEIETVPVAKPVSAAPKKTTRKSESTKQAVAEVVEQVDAEQPPAAEKTELENMPTEEPANDKPAATEPTAPVEPVETIERADEKPEVAPVPQVESAASSVVPAEPVVAAKPQPVIQTAPSASPPEAVSPVRATNQPATAATTLSPETKAEPKQATQQTVSLPTIKLPQIPKFRMPTAASGTSALTRNIGTFAYIVLALAAAQIALVASPAVGLYVNATAFAALVILGMRSERTRELAISTAILPLAMLVLLVLPAQTPFARTAEFMALLLVLGLTYRYLFTLDHPVAATRLRMTRYGLLFALPLMVVLGQVLGLLGYGLLRNQYGFQGTPVALVVMSAIVFAVTEEIIFRGLIQQRAMRIFHPAVAAVLSAILFALFSIGHQGGALTPLFGALLGGVLAFVYYKKQNLLLTIAVNAAAKLTYVGLVLLLVFR